jgi:hypothetical protein
MTPALPDPLRGIARALATTSIAELFERDARRVERLTFAWDAFRVDLAKERITPEARATPACPRGSPRCSPARR